MIVAGIDEAGYGPLLGPLVVGATVFSIQDDQADKSLWDILHESISPTASKRDRRLPIADSKKLYNRKDGLLTLERTALVMLKVAGRTPKVLRGLLRTISPGTLEMLSEYPWYQDLDVSLPTATTSSDISTRANAVHRDLTENNIELVGIHTTVLPEGHFNRRVAQVRNKAVVLADASLRLIKGILDRSGSQPVLICVDRQGGRQHYGEQLMTFFEGSSLKIVEESDQRSAYVITQGGRAWSLEFGTGGETRHLPIALASVYGKYARELLMHRLNDYFLERIDELKPTAGYYTDGCRFLEDIKQVIDAEKIDKTMLVRER